MLSPQSPAEKNRSAVAKHYNAHKDDVLKRKAEARLAKGLGITKATAEKFGLEMPEKPEDPRVVKMQTWMNDNKTTSTAKMYGSQLKKSILGADSDDPIAILKWIEENVEQPNTKRTALQALLCYSEDCLEVLHAYNLANQMAEEYSIQRMYEDTVVAFTDIKEKIIETFPEGSDERLYIELYDILPVRDDYGSIELCGKDTKPVCHNWLDTTTREIHIGKHKTAAKYGPIKMKLPTKFMKLIPTDRKFLFCKDDKPHGCMSKFVGDMLSKVGVEKGSINYLRHSYASTELAGSKIKDEAKRRDLFSRMQHSAVTQLKYLRALESTA